MKDAAEQIEWLQHCINDLVSMLAPSSLWSGREPSRIVETLLDALLRMVRLDFAYVQQKDPGVEVPVEALRVSDSYKLKVRPEKIRELCSNCFPKSPSSQTPLFGERGISIFPLALGLDGEIGTVLVGSERKDFPTQTERLLLSVAANQVSIRLQEARLLAKQKRIAGERDGRVAARTSELAKANHELRKEIGERKKIEERLLKSEAALQKAFDEIKKSEVKLRQVIDAIPTLAWCNLPDGSNEFLNKGWHEYTGLSREESHGWGWQVAFHGEDLPLLMKRWQELLISGEPGEIEARLRRHDGVYQWFLIRVAPFRDEAGNLVRWYGTSTHIEDRKRAEEGLQASERDFGLIINTIPALAWSARSDGSAEFFNRRWLDYTGLSSEKAGDWGWTIAIHPEDRDRMVNYWRAAVAAGEPVEIEGRLRRADGDYRWFLFRASPLRNESDAIVKWYGTNVDIDDRKRAEEQVRRSEAFLVQGQRLSRTGTFSWRPDTNAVTWSEENYRIHEIEPGTPISIDLARIGVHPDDIPLVNEAAARGWETNSDYEHSHRIVMSDGRIKFLHVRAHATKDSEGRQEYIGAVQDVTEHRLSEEALSKARSELANVGRVTTLGVLTASIAHEVNQPLSGIITNASTCLRMLSADPPNIEGARETARRAIRDGNRASDVITRLRTLYSKKELQLEPMDLNEAAREVTSLSLIDLQRNRVVVRHELAQNLPTVMGDRIQLQQVILNLVRNASDAMSTVNDRPRELLIRTEWEGVDGVRLSVKDAGVGFTSHTEEKLFEAFYTTKTDGMGVGLSISLSIIEAHHGRLWASPNHGPGVTFSFAIPCRPEGLAEVETAA